MITDIQMPQLGESVTEGTIVRWLKKPGDSVAKYEPICEVSTDKVNAEVPSTIAGTIVEITAEEGVTIQTGQVICRIEESCEHTMRSRYSPAVLRLAQENEIDLHLIQGTGKGGRITRKDVLSAISPPVVEEKPVAVPSSVVAEKSVIAPSVEEESRLENGDIEIPLTSVRRAIARRMMVAKHEIPHAWVMMEVDLTHLVALRNRVKEDFKKREGFNLTFMPFFIKAVVDSLKEFPYLNSVWKEEQIILKKHIHISIAVAAKEALYVPVIHYADEKNILGLAKSVYQLVQKTRAGQLEPKDIQNGTFTVNNTGSFGSIASAPIINHPQAATLSFEAIVKRPIIDHDMIAIRDMMNLCLSIDHRILDGWTAGQFLKRVKERLQSHDIDM